MYLFGGNNDEEGEGDAPKSTIGGARFIPLSTNKKDEDKKSNVITTCTNNINNDNDAPSNEAFNETIAAATPATAVEQVPLAVPPVPVLQPTNPATEPVSFYDQLTETCIKLRSLTATPAQVLLAFPNTTARRPPADDCILFQDTDHTHTTLESTVQQLIHKLCDNEQQQQLQQHEKQTRFSSLASLVALFQGLVLDTAEPASPTTTVDDDDDNNTTPLMDSHAHVLAVDLVAKCLAVLRRTLLESPPCVLSYADSLVNNYQDWLTKTATTAAVTTTSTTTDKHDATVLQDATILQLLAQLPRSQTLLLWTTLARQHPATIHVETNDREFPLLLAHSDNAATLVTIFDLQRVLATLQASANTYAARAQACTAQAFAAKSNKKVAFDHLRRRRLLNAQWELAMQKHANAEKVLFALQEARHNQDIVRALAAAQHELTASSSGVLQDMHDVVDGMAEHVAESQEIDALFASAAGFGTNNDDDDAALLIELEGLTLADDLPLAPTHALLSNVPTTSTTTINRKDTTSSAQNNTTTSTDSMSAATAQNAF
jgi:hypothetical protein